MEVEFICNNYISKSVNKTAEKLKENSKLPIYEKDGHILADLLRDIPDEEILETLEEMYDNQKKW